MQIDGKYKYVFLVDDFSASGQSYLRHGRDGKPKGKMAHFDKARQEGQLKDILEDKVQVYVVLYIATKEPRSTN